MSTEEALMVRRAAHQIGNPWAVPPDAASFDLRKSEDGTDPVLRSRCFVYFDQSNLYALFQCNDEGVLATYRQHDQPLYEEDVVEIFLAPESITHYYEIEVNPLGTHFDARIHSPDGERKTMQVDRAWKCEGLTSAIRKTHHDQGRTLVETIVTIPFSALGRSTPESAEEWRANFFRIDRGAVSGDEYSAWCPTMKSPADFHVPEHFGRLVFSPVPCEVA